MNRKLIAVAIAATMAAPLSALAEIELGARLQVELYSFDDGSDDGIVMDDADSSGEYNALWFQGSEKLGNGWTAFGKANFKPDFNGGSLGGRDIFIGMKNDLLSVSGGRINSAYKKVSVQYDPFLATALQARGNGGMSGSGENAANTSTSTSPLAHFGHSSYLEDVLEGGLNFGSITANFQYIADDDEFGTNGNGGSGANGNIVDGSYSGFVKWAEGPFEAFGAFSHAETEDVATGNDSDYDNWKLGGKFSFGDATVTAQYESAELGVLNTALGADNNDEADIIFVSGTYKLGNITLAGWVSDYDQDALDGTNWALGAMYNFSKRTRLHAGYRQTDLEANQTGLRNVEEDVFSVGMRFVL